MDRPTNLDPRRDSDVTASDVPTICGECPYQTRRSVLFKKSLKLFSAETPAMKHGHDFEPIALRKFCEKTGAVIKEYPCEYRRHETYTWLGGTMDALVTMPTGEVIIVEIKCPVSRQIKDEVPYHYIGQVQTYMFISPQYPYAMFVQYKPAGKRSLEKLEITRVERDEEYMALRMPSLWKFWKEMQEWAAYTERIVVVIQRAWRSYLYKKSRDQAAHLSMLARLRCAKMVGKMSGFCKRCDCIGAYNRPEDHPPGDDRCVVCDDGDAPRMWMPRPKRPRISAFCLVSD